LTVAASPLSKGLKGHIYTCGVICHNRSADVQNEKLVRKLASRDVTFNIYPFLRFGRLQLFSTENKYLGLGPRSSCPEDQVWIFEQARVPFILRAIPDSEHFHLVGECYVHGVMQGELVDKIKFKRIGLA
jgi:hypothetical protein